MWSITLHLFYKVSIRNILLPYITCFFIILNTTKTCPYACTMQINPKLVKYKDIWLLSLQNQFPAIPVNISDSFNSVKILTINCVQIVQLDGYHFVCHHCPVLRVTETNLKRIINFTLVQSYIEEYQTYTTVLILQHE